MVLVAVDALCPTIEMKKLSVMPEEVSYNNSLACFKVNSNDLPRRRPKSCINEHPKVGDIVISRFCLLSVCVYILCFCVSYCKPKKSHLYVEILFLPSK